ncbi:DUF2334 domain-containing protein [Exiguobacterium algae]|uniref:DUF2334 domain-containing protein n=1 Tax=Exiguobacterium algae TaxID=2751250 RepID=UPI001BEB056D|nr:DUF2334 domain-containing protein [Exiguobacterium algae]
MLYKFFLLIGTLCLLFYASPASAKETPHVLIIYTSVDEEIPPDVLKLETLVSRFSDQIQVVRDRNLESDSFEGATHLFVYHQQGQLLPKAKQLIDEQEIPLYAIGQSATVLQAFDALSFKRIVSVSHFEQERSGKQVEFEGNEPVIVTTDLQKVTPHALTLSNQHLPVIFSYQHNYYAGLSTLLNRSHLLFSDTLFDFFDVQAKAEHVGYLRLEDVSPSADPELVDEVGTYLLDHHVPILMAVVPIYTDPETGNVVQFSDRPELLQVLKKLEDRGATVLLHGYTHQYRSSETGEGFEFWDVENGQPIFGPASEEAPILQSKEAFANHNDYQSYQKEMHAREEAYIRDKLERGVRDLTTLGLHPLGFEAPHYAMSHTGYELTADYFTNIFGQVQWGQEEWDVMTSVPFVTNPPFLNYMTLYPETIGFVDPQLSDPVKVMEQARDEMLLVRESMIGAFYHPYLGIEYVPEIVEMMESTPHFRWLSLRETNPTVTTSNLSIRVDASGQFIVEDQRSVWSAWVQRFAPHSFLEQALFLLAVVTFLAVAAFSLYTFYLRTQRKKRLFKERAPRG